MTMSRRLDGSSLGRNAVHAVYRASILAYLDHPNTLGVFTTTFQDLNHPKAHSIPLGVKRIGDYYDMQLKKGPSYRTNLLMINAAENMDSRGRQIDFVMSALRKNSGLNLSNTYKRNKYDEYFDELRCSKFILCPCGLGWDTYRMWEAFVMGAIPIVERYNRTDGWHRTMEGLPMLWVDTFEDKDLWTVDFLEAEYDRIVSVDAAEYRYEKLTIPYWKNFVESLLVLGKDGDEEEVTRMTKANNTGEDLDIEVLHTDTDSSAGLKQQQQQQQQEKSSEEKEKESKEKKEKSEESIALTSEQFSAIEVFLSKQSMDVCDDRKLKFNVSSMVGLIPDTYFVYFGGSSSPGKNLLGYGPKLTKTGTTSTVDGLKELFREKGNNNIKNQIDASSSSLLLNKGTIFFMATIRHPMDRILAGYHQVEVFLRMDWFGDTIEKFDLKWWNRYCIVETEEWKERDVRHRCTSVERKSDDVTRLKRYHAFLDDIRTIGFYDHHIMPMTYQMQITHHVVVSRNIYYFDTKSIPAVLGNISSIILDDNNKPHNTNNVVKMKRQDSNPWVIRWKELQSWAATSERDKNSDTTTDTTSNDNNNNSNDEVMVLAKGAIQKMCNLYKNDIDCLPYDVPECHSKKERE